MTWRTGVLLPQNTQASSSPAPPRPTSAGCSVSSTTRSARLPRRDRPASAPERRAPPSAPRARSRPAATEAPGPGLAHVAGAGFQPAGVFQPAQLLDRAGADIAVAADPEAAAGARNGAQREDAVAEIGLGGLAQARRPRRCAAKAGCFGCRHVGGVDEAPARPDRRVVRAAIAPAARRSRRGSPRLRGSVRRRGCAAAWPGRARRRRRSRPPARPAARHAGCAGRRRPARGAPGAGTAPQRRPQSSTNRRWPAVGGRAAEAAVAIQHRQQGQADAGRLGRGERCARTVSAGSA